MRLPNLIDIEASGLHFDAWPLEIALLCAGQLHSWLIRPETHWQHWSEDAQALHGISRDILQEQGLPAKAVAMQLNQVLAASNGLVYSDACQWDEDWLNTLFHATGEIRQFHVLPIDDLLSEAQQERLHQARADLLANGKYRQHRAAPDVCLLRDAYQMVTGN